MWKIQDTKKTLSALRGENTPSSEVSFMMIHQLALKAYLTGLRHGSERPSLVDKGVADE